jgi:hypothetical protein
MVKLHSVRNSNDQTELTLVVCSYLIDPMLISEKLMAIGSKLGISVRGVIVVNNPAMSSDCGGGVFDIIRGSNEILDFSAYIEGAKWVASSSEDEPRHILFLNDRFLTSMDVFGYFRLLLSYLSLISDLDGPVLAGLRRGYNSVCMHNPWSKLDIYIPTFCFLLNKQGLDSLTQLPQLAIDDGLSLDEDLSLEFGVGKVSIAFREYLRAHCLLDSSPFSWKNAGDYCVDSDLIRKKLRCVYFEHRLSGVIGDFGSIIPIDAGFKNTLKMKLRGIFFD